MHENATVKVNKHGKIIEVDIKFSSGTYGGTVKIADVMPANIRPKLEYIPFVICNSSNNKVIGNALGWIQRTSPTNAYFPEQYTGTWRAHIVYTI